MNLLIKVRCDLNEFINITFINHIDILDLKYLDNYVICYIYNSDLDKLNKYYKVIIIKNKDIKYYLNNIKNNIINYIIVLIGIVMFYFLSNMIISVNIESNNNILVKDISNSLESYGIKRLSFKKNFVELKDVKNKLLEEYKSRLEWVEIENIGMTYKISLEERKNKDIITSNSYCDVVAVSDGTISKIISSSGVVLTKLNSVVKEGDVLISGSIKLNDVDKANICASGKVYANKWYSLSIELPKTYKLKKYTNKFRYNLLFEGNKDYKIFKSRLSSYDTDKKEIISILGNKLYLLKEYEYIIKEYGYDEGSLENRVNELIREKLELSLLDDEKIISKKVLKKEENDSRIIIEIFIIVERLISNLLLKV